MSFKDFVLEETTPVRTVTDGSRNRLLLFPMIKTKIYSPRQVTCSAFFGGPFAGIFTLKRNFDLLGNKRGSKLTLIWGLVFCIILFIFFAYLPLDTNTHCLDIAITVAYTLAARHVADRYQMSQLDIIESEQHEFRSNWNVFGVIVVSLIAFIMVATIAGVSLALLGLLNLDS